MKLQLELRATPFWKDWFVWLLLAGALAPIYATSQDVVLRRPVQGGNLAALLVMTLPATTGLLVRAHRGKTWRMRGSDDAIEVQRLRKPQAIAWRDVARARFLPLQLKLTLRDGSRQTVNYHLLSQYDVQRLASVIRTKLGHVLATRKTHL